MCRGTAREDIPQGRVIYPPRRAAARQERTCHKGEPFAQNPAEPRHGKGRHITGASRYITSVLGMALLNTIEAESICALFGL